MGVVTEQLLDVRGCVARDDDDGHSRSQPALDDALQMIVIEPKAGAQQGFSLGDTSFISARMASNSVLTNVS